MGFGRFDTEPGGAGEVVDSRMPSTLRAEAVAKYSEFGDDGEDEGGLADCEDGAGVDAAGVAFGCEKYACVEAEMAEMVFERLDGPFELGVEGPGFELGSRIGALFGEKIVLFTRPAARGLDV